MAYKKFIRKGVKTFEHSDYEGYRDSVGKVKKKYAGATGPKWKNFKKLINKNLFYGILLLVITLPFLIFSSINWVFITMLGNKQGCFFGI